jgi:hypothetical protein
MNVLCQRHGQAAADSCTASRSVTERPFLPNVAKFGRSVAAKCVAIKRDWPPKICGIIVISREVCQYGVRQATRSASGICWYWRRWRRHGSLRTA